MSEFGFVFLLLGLAAAVFSALAYLFGARSKNDILVTGARRGLYVAGAFVTAAVLVLFVALITHDYSIAYVADYSSNHTSLGYLISALWAGNDGSLLFWAWLTAIFAAIVVARRRTTNRDLVPYTAAVMMITLAFFLVLIVSTANPFAASPVVPADGNGLNPMLENPGMVIHPPALLAGYVCFVVPFAFAIAALIKRKLGTEWLGAARTWALVAWLFLGAGNLIGMWWAYVELGWGGYWGWDPVENAGLMPWLVATAFLHSIIVQRRKGMFKLWSMLLVITTFCLVIFGTFLTRSGFLSSVHTYGVSSMGPFFVIFLGGVIIASIYLLVTRRQELRSEGEVERLISREGTFLIGNLLLVGSALIIFFGTMYPSITDLFTGSKVEVGPSFFNTVNGPLFLVIVLFIGLCTLISWRSMTARRFFSKLRWPAAVAVIVAVIMVATGVRNGYAVVGGFITALALSAVLIQWLFDGLEVRRATDTSLVSGLGRTVSRNKPRYGAFIVHFAVAVIAVGVIGSSLFDVEQEVSLAPGTSTEFNGYTFAFGQLTSRQLPDRVIVEADVTVSRGGKVIATMTPQEIMKNTFNQWVVEVDIHSTAARDIYVILGGWDQSGTAVFTFKIIPFAIWIWIGGGIFLAGSLLALWPRTTPVRLRAPTAVEAATPEPEETAGVPVPAAAATAGSLDDEIEKQVAARRTRRGRFCPQCGKPTAPADRFCAECGTDLRSAP
jgi:cytochrome c-type biogenesis protein CcmF